MHLHQPKKIFKKFWSWQNHKPKRESTYSLLESHLDVFVFKIDENAHIMF